MKIKNIKKSVLISIVGLALLQGCGSVINAPDWKLIQSVGGLTIEDPVFNDGEWFLPVNLDVSSYKAGTKSELVCTETKTRVFADKIELSIRTDSKRNRPEASSKCPAAKIGLPLDGDYAVVFKDPEGLRHDLKSINIKL